MVCFSFMADGFEDTWLFIRAQYVELTDFCKNLEGRRKEDINSKTFKNNSKEKFLVGKSFFPIKQQLLYWTQTISCHLLLL